MRILMLGEYSGFYNSLAKGFRTLGCEVTLMSDGDGFKNYPRDINLGSPIKNRFLSHLHRILKQFYHVKTIKGYDVVFVINPLVFSRFTFVKWMLNYISENNSKVIYSVAGDDSIYWLAFRNGVFQYSSHQGTLIDEGSDKSIWESKRCIDLTNYLVNQRKVTTVLCGVDYYLAYQSFGLARHFIPLPFNPSVSSAVQKSKASDQDNVKDLKVRIFHGVQSKRVGFKGSKYFDDAMEIICSRYQQNVIYNRVSDVPFLEYSTLLEESDIVLDQVNSHGPGMNALHAMSLGKVVLSGFESSLLKLMKLDAAPLVNVGPCVDEIVTRLDLLINDFKLRREIGQRASAYVRNLHNPKKIAQEYLSLI